MKLIAAIPAAALLAFAAPALAQTNGAGATNGNTEDLGAIPESMRIEQNVQRQFYQANPQAQSTNQNQPSTDAPGGAQSPAEHNRLDPAAPSRNRLQIDEGQSARAIQNPDDTSTQTNPSNPGTTYNTIIEGSPSTNGTSTGTSGTAGTSTSTVPSVSPSIGGTSGTTSSGGLSSGTSGAGAAGSSAGGGSAGGGGR